jgi:hypothetical protein
MVEAAFLRWLDGFPPRLYIRVISAIRGENSSSFVEKNPPFVEKCKKISQNIWWIHF